LINKHFLIGCENQVIELSKYLSDYAKRLKTELKITSGLRYGSGKSWHDKGLAIDFVFENINIFMVVTPLYLSCLQQHVPFKGITEFEVCRRNRDNKQHIHLAFGKEKRLESFTGIYVD